MAKIGNISLWQAAPSQYTAFVTESAYYDIDLNFRFLAFVAEARMPDDYVMGYAVKRLDLNNFMIEDATQGPDSEKWQKEPDISADGRTITFKAEPSGGGSYKVLRKDFTTGTLTTLASGKPGAPDHTGGSTKGADGSVASRGGHFVATMNSHNGNYSIVVTDKGNGAVVTVPTTASEAYSPDRDAPDKPYVQAISPDGRFVLYLDWSSGFNGTESQLNLLDLTRYSTFKAAQAGRDVALDIETNDAAKVSVTWGDGAIATETAGGGKTTLMHGYQADGTYTVTIKALGSSSVIRARNVVIDTLVEEGETQQILSGTGGHDIVLGSSVSDVVALGSGNDTARTRDGNDSIKGGSGHDTLMAGAGDDTLMGGSGIDVLSGGKGKDVFVFDTNPVNANLNKITDFDVKDDAVWLDNKVFTKLGKAGTEAKPAKLNKAFFTIGDKAKDKNNYVIHDPKKGVLFYDRDGSGPAKAVEIATLKKGLKMTAADFFVI